MISRESTTPLAGVRVLDLGRYIAAPYCAALLGDFGAEVIRIEPPEGAPDREVMLLGDAGFGAMHAQVNRSKLSLALATDRSEGREVLEQAIRQSDVVTINLGPARLKRLGLDFATLSALNPRLILTSVSAYGFEGDQQDRSGFDTSGQALSGAMHLTGFGDQPLRAAVSYVDFSTAIYAAFATMGALMARSRDGTGREVRASLLASALSMVNPMLIEEATGARHRGPIGNRSPIAGPSDLFRSKDGWILVQIIGDAMFERWCSLVDRPDLMTDPRFGSDQARGDNGADLSAIMTDWCSRRDCVEALALLEAAGIPACRQLPLPDVLSAPEVADGGFFTWHSQAGLHYPVVAPPVRLGGLTGSTPAPGVGQHSREVLARLGYDDARIEWLIAKEIVAAPDN